VEGLGINLPTLLAQVVNFAILLGLLYLVAYKPIMRILDERSRKIRESMEQTELIKQQAERAREEVKEQLAHRRRSKTKSKAGCQERCRNPHWAGTGGDSKRAGRGY